MQYISRLDAQVVSVSFRTGIRATPRALVLSGQAVIGQTVAALDVLTRG